MGLILDNKGISSMTFNGKKVKECWLNGEKIWPKYTTVLDTITEISKSHDASSQPIHVALLDGNLDQSPIIMVILHTCQNLLMVVQELDMVKVLKDRAEKLFHALEPT